MLGGHQGKVWSVSVDRYRLASGGRYGEIRVWTLGDTAARLARSEELEDPQSQPEALSETEEEQYGEGRVLFGHPRSSSVASLHLDRFGLVSGDGLALIIQWDFWSSQVQSCPCKQYNQPVPDPLIL